MQHALVEVEILARHGKYQDVLENLVTHCRSQFRWFHLVLPPCPAGSMLGNIRNFVKRDDGDQ
jgi:hypothetical protein